MKLSKFVEFFLLLLCNSKCDNFFVSGWLIMKSFALFFVFLAICIKPISSFNVHCVCSSHFLVFLVCLMICFITKVGNFIFHNIWSLGFIFPLHKIFMGPLLNEGLKGAAPNSFCRPLIILPISCESLAIHNDTTLNCHFETHSNFPQSHERGNN
jgi:hypothetical protein